jgi:hypothetical protein
MHADPRIFFCDGCQDETPWFRPSEASQREKVSRRTIYKWIAAGVVHVRREPGGRLLICWCSVCKGSDQNSPRGRSCTQVCTLMQIVEA